MSEDIAMSEDITMSEDMSNVHGVTTRSRKRLQRESCDTPVSEHQLWHDAIVQEDERLRQEDVRLRCEKFSRDTLEMVLYIIGCVACWSAFSEPGPAFWMEAIGMFVIMNGVFGPWRGIRGYGEVERNRRRMMRSQRAWRNLDIDD